MQIKLTPENQKLIEAYRLRTPDASAPWHPSSTVVANHIIEMFFHPGENQVFVVGAPKTASAKVVFTDGIPSDAFKLNK